MLADLMRIDAVRTAMSTDRARPRRALFLLVWDGDGEYTEKDLQARIGASRCKGEWYDITPDVDAFLDEQMPGSQVSARSDEPPGSHLGSWLAPGVGG